MKILREEFEELTKKAICVTVAHAMSRTDGVYIDMIKNVINDTEQAVKEVRVIAEEPRKVKVSKFDYRKLVECSMKYAAIKYSSENRFFLKEDLKKLLDGMEHLEAVAKCDACGRILFEEDDINEIDEYTYCVGCFHLKDKEAHPEKR